MGVPITGFLIVINMIYESEVKPKITCYHKKPITYSPHSSAQQCAKDCLRDLMKEAKPIFLTKAEEETSERSKQKYTEIASSKVLQCTRGESKVFAKVMKEEFKDYTSGGKDKKDRSFAAILGEVKKHMCTVYCLTDETYDVVPATTDDLEKLHFLHSVLFTMDQFVVEDMQKERSGFFSNLNDLCANSLQQDLKEGEIFLQLPAQNLQANPGSLPQPVAPSESVNSKFTA